jgi:hypothetical protein
VQDLVYIVDEGQFAEFNICTEKL